MAGDGMAELQIFARDLMKAPLSGRVMARLATRKAGLDLVKYGKQWCRKMDVIDTGATINSIGVDFADVKDGFEAVAGPTTNYAMYPHNGTRFVAPRPYMYKAANRVMKSWEKAMAEAAKGVLGK